MPGGRIGYHPGRPPRLRCSITDFTEVNDIDVVHSRMIVLTIEHGVTLYPAQRIKRLSGRRCRRLRPRVYEPRQDSRLALAAKRCAGILDQIEPCVVEVSVRVADAQVDPEGCRLTLEVDRQLSVCALGEPAAGDVLHLDQAAHLPATRELEVDGAPPAVGFAGDIDVLGATVLDPC